MTSPAKKRKLTVDEVPESSSRLLDLVNVPQTSRNNDVNTTLDYLQYTGFDHWKSVSFTSNVSSSKVGQRRNEGERLEDTENRASVNLPDSSFTSSLKSDRS